MSPGCCAAIRDRGLVSIRHPRARWLSRQSTSSCRIRPRRSRPPARLRGISTFTFFRLLVFALRRFVDAWACVRKISARLPYSSPRQRRRPADAGQESVAEPQHINGSLEDNLPAGGACAGPRGRHGRNRDHLRLVLDHEDGVALVGSRSSSGSSAGYGAGADQSSLVEDVGHVRSETTRDGRPSSCAAPRRQRASRTADRG